ncbi:hypothetical protein C8T65DRAFT_641187 [Cerioporus squamosus]|nr:hypothetical protein C8T65DRAFT_641187 [Cerioporus squamosus]
MMLLHLNLCASLATCSLKSTDSEQRNPDGSTIDLRSALVVMLVRHDTLSVPPHASTSSTPPCICPPATRRPAKRVPV